MVSEQDLREMHAKPYILAGRRYTLAYLRLRVKRVKAKGREYRQYYINLPRQLAEAILESAGREPPEPGTSGVLLTAIVTPSPWYHALDWSSIPMDDLPERIEKEITALGLHQLDKPLALIPADPDKLRQLGLDPEKPITLEDLIEAVRRKVLAEAPTQ